MEFPAALRERPQIVNGPWVSVRNALVEAERDPSAVEVAAEIVRLEGPVDLRSDAFARHLAALREGRAPAVADMLAVLGAVESRPTFDPELALHLWRRAPAHARPQLHARLVHHLRVCEALASVPEPTARGPGLDAAAIERSAKERIAAVESAYAADVPSRWEPLT